MRITRSRSGGWARELPAFVLLTGLAGCASVPDLGPRPEPAPSSAFAATRSLGGSHTEWPADRWWQDFEDAQLDRLVTEALASSPTVAQAEARIRVALSHTDLARAARMPHANVAAMAQAARITQSIGLPTDGEWHGLVAGLANVRYDVDLWHEHEMAVRAALSAQQVSAADAATARLVIASAVATAYVEFAHGMLRREVAADAERIRREMRDLVAARFKAGLESQGPFEQAEGGVESARADLAAIDESLELARHALAALMGAGPDRGLEITAPSLRRRRPSDLPLTVPIDLAGRKPDVVAARWRVEAAAARVGVARAGFYPNVSLSGLIGLASFGLGALIDSRSAIGSAGPAVSLPIFDGGRRSATYGRARAEYDEAVAAYNSSLLRALREAADAATSLQALGPRITATEAALARHEAAWRLNRIRYDAGLSDYQAVLVSENALLAVREQAASLRLRGFLLDVALANALGGGFRIPDRPANHDTEARAHQ